MQTKQIEYFTPQQIPDIRQRLVGKVIVDIENLWFHLGFKLNDGSEFQISTEKMYGEEQERLEYIPPLS